MWVQSRMINGKINIYAVHNHTMDAPQNDVDVSFYILEIGHLGAEILNFKEGGSVTWKSAKWLNCLIVLSTKDGNRTTHVLFCLCLNRVLVVDISACARDLYARECFYFHVSARRGRSTRGWVCWWSF